MAEMKRDDELDAVLRQELGSARTIEPSAGFVSGVMKRVREDEAMEPEPSPIRFPWRRAAPGICMAVLMVLFCIGGAVRAGLDALQRASSGSVAVSAAPQYPQWTGYAAEAARLHIGWLVLVMFIALLPLPLSRGLLEDGQHS